MKTEQDLYLYAKENNLPLYFKRTSLKMFKKCLFFIDLEKEKILVGFLGVHNYRGIFRSDGFYAYVLTNERLVFSNDKNSSFQNIEDISLIGYKKNKITISLNNNNFVIYCSSKNETKNVFELFKEYLEKLKISKYDIEIIKKNKEDIKEEVKLKECDTKIKTENLPINISLKTNYYFDTYVAGLEHRINKKDIDNYLKEEAYNNFEETTAKEIREEDEYNFEYKLWQYEHSEDNTVLLEYEPTNEYDKNAIKIIHDELGFVGYIPKKHCTEVKNILENHSNINFELVFLGGKYKYVDSYEDKIKTASKPFYLNIRINYSLNLNNDI